MVTNPFKHRGLWVFFVVALVAVLSALSSHATDSSPSSSPTQLTTLADSGRFGQALDLLTASPTGQHDAQVAALIKDLQQYQQNEAQRAATQKEAYEKALADVDAKLQEDKIEEALASAVNAMNQAEDPQTVRDNPTVQGLVKQTEQAAQTAETSGDWVEALGLYRTLDALFDDMATYRPRVKRAAQHLRLMRLYAPKQLEVLYVTRAKRLGKDAPKLLNFDEETWQDQLKGIKLSMLRQTLAHAARRHVANQGYAPLLRGAIDEIIVMTETRDLGEAFAGFNDPKKVAGFREALLNMRRRLDERGRPMNYLDAASLIDKIKAVNDQTVQLPDEVLTYELTEGATDTLDDFSAAIWPTELEAFSRNTQGKFSGVGIQISLRDERLIVVSPLEATPAQRAGIKAGDIIATVDSRDTSSWSLDRAVREITGPQGSDVTLGIERAGKSDLIDFVLTRAEIVIESIRGWQRKPSGGWDYWIDPEQRIGYVRLSQFIPQSASDLDAAINEMESDGQINGLILDLRLNPGGLLSSSVELSDRFISKGPIVSTVGPDGERTSQFRARADRTHTQLPLVVLINEGSASASEILSGALQDYQRALIVGTRSFGKGSVQDLFPLSGDKAYLKLTTQYYMLPGGRIIHRKPNAKIWGIEPDLAVKMTTKQMSDAMEFRQKVDVLRGDTEPTESDEPAPTADQIIPKGLDPQLEAALLVLKTRQVAQKIAIAQSHWPVADP
jgi:carboxyl-terminal processing protease